MRKAQWIRYTTAPDIFMKVSSGKTSGGKGKTSGGILVYYKKEFKICVIPGKVI